MLQSEMGIKSRDHVSNSQKIRKQNILFGRIKVAFLYFKQLPLNTKQKFESSCHLILAERLLSVVLGVSRFLIKKFLDFHDTTFSVLPSLLKL